MPRIATALVLAVSVALAPGCGTVCNLAGGHPKPYGGVRGDADFMTRSDTLGPLCDGPAPRDAAMVVLGLWAADMGVCLVTDTLTLPLVLCWDKVGVTSWLPRRAYPVDEPGRQAGFAAGAAADLEAGP